MSAPLTHATVNGLILLRGDTSDDTSLFVVACTGYDWLSMVPDRIIGARALRDTIPTCPRCAVLRDAALEGREVMP